MTEKLFRTADGRPVPAVTAEEMRAVDRVAVEEVGLELLQMMENAGRNLATAARERTDGDEPVVVLAGSGGNGGGGLACARHLANHGRSVSVVLDRPADQLSGAAASQHRILDAMDLPISVGPEGLSADGVVVDALVGYSLSDPLRGTAADLVDSLGDRRILSLDVPTGRDATTGEEAGLAIDPDTVVTLALPKTGLAGLDCSLLLADIAIPKIVYERLDIATDGIFDGAYLLELTEHRTDS
ncbi:NAD(P)H-hydrate epimerase [Halovenus sp. HT40]|uniref:NAD(P)H-hydrate epimerase n=1 Tax=Halovenus sp. HT40 TaxID=3126691 RepID=UPI00300E9E8B